MGEALQSYFDPAGADFDDEWNFTEPGPGDSREYSNMGFSLAAHVIEGSAGEFAALSTTRVMEPLGMEHSSWHQADLDLDQVALPYKVRRGQFVSQGHYAFPDYSSGGLHASAPDLARFLGGWQDVLDVRIAEEALRVHHQIDELDVADVDNDAVFVVPGGSLAKSQAGGISCISDRSEIQRAGRLGPRGPYRDLRR